MLTDSPLPFIPVSWTAGTAAGAGGLIFFTSLASSSRAACDGLWLFTSSWVGRGGLGHPPLVSSNNCLWCNLGHKNISLMMRSFKHFSVKTMYDRVMMAFNGWSDFYLCLLRIFSSLASSAVSRAGDDVRGQTVAKYWTSWTCWPGR